MAVRGRNDIPGPTVWALVLGITALIFAGSAAFAGLFFAGRLFR